MDQSRHQTLDADRVQPYAPYGKAFASCAKSKTRCAVASIGGTCERCHRLDKDCQPAPSVRKKRVSKKSVSSSSSKTAALEEKLDGLVQMLQRSQTSIPEMTRAQNHIQNQKIDSKLVTLSSSEVSQARNTPHYGGNNQVNTDYTDFVGTDNPPSMRFERLGELAHQNVLPNFCKFRLAAQQELNGRSANVNVNGPLTPATSTCSHSTERDKRSTSRDYPPESEAQLEEHLKSYRTTMVAYLPIVCISPDMTLENLRKQRPFLFLVIRAICSKNLERQAALLKEVKKMLGTEMLLQGSRNLDLFLGILVFAGWCHLYICNRPIMSTIIHLAMSLASDLGLTKSPPTESSSVMLNFTAQGCPRPITGAVPTRSMEERRAVVGLYLVSSVCASYFQRIELMRWTRYLDECLHLLEGKKEYPTDVVLVYLTRVQLICNQGETSTINDLFGDAEMRVPADFYAKSLKLQLEELERSVPSELSSNVTLQLQILNTTLTIHERSLTSTPRSTSYNPSHKLQSAENLWICFTAVKSWFNIFFSLEAFPLSSYSHFSMIPLTQMWHCLVVLFRLSIFESPNVPWDRQRVRQKMNFGDIVQLVFDRWEQVPEANGIEMSPRMVEVTEDGVWSEQSWLHAMKRILVLRSLWEAKVAAMTAADAEKVGGLIPEDGGMNKLGGPGMQQMDVMEFEGMDVDFLDDAWIKDMLGGGSDFGF